LSGANFMPYCVVYAIRLLYTLFGLMQFFTVVLPHIIRFILSINPNTIVFWLPSNVFKNSNIKNRNRIGNRGDPYKIPVSVNIGSLS